MGDSRNAARARYPGQRFDWKTNLYSINEYCSKMVLLVLLVQITQIQKLFAFSKTVQVFDRAIVDISDKV